MRSVSEPVSAPVAHWHVGLSGDQNPSDGVLTKIAFDTEIVRSEGVFFDSSNNRVYILVGGNYEIAATLGYSVTGTSAAGSAELQFYKNGSGSSPDVTGRESSGTVGNAGFVDVVSLEAGDYVEVYGSAADVDSNAVFESTDSAGNYVATAFSGRRVGP